MIDATTRVVPVAKVDDGAVITSVSRTRNTFTLEVDASRPSRILLNSGYDRGWRSNVGTVIELSHQLVLELPAGHHAVKMRYWPEKLTLGVSVSLVGLLGSLLFLFRRQLARLFRRKPKPSLA